LSISTGTAVEGFSGSLAGTGVGMEREYFSRSLLETKKTAREDRAGVGGDLGALKRSSSYNADMYHSGRNQPPPPYKFSLPLSPPYKLPL
jgi:hypothetical protein